MADHLRFFFETRMIPGGILKNQLDFWQNEDHFFVLAFEVGDNISDSSPHSKHTHSHAVTGPVIVHL